MGNDVNVSIFSILRSLPVLALKDSFRCVKLSCFRLLQILLQISLSFLLGNLRRFESDQLLTSLFVFLFINVFSLYDIAQALGIFQKFPKLFSS